MVDELPERVVLVGHSGGGAVAHAVVDARPERIARVIYVDTLPFGHGEAINPDLPVVGGEIPFPDWSEFDDHDLVDLTDELRERLRGMAVPEPAAVASDQQQLHDERRSRVPVTVICCEFTSEMLRGWLDEGHKGVADLADAILAALA